MSNMRNMCSDLTPFFWEREREWRLNEDIIWYGAKGKFANFYWAGNYYNLRIFLGEGNDKSRQVLLNTGVKVLCHVDVDEKRCC